jgi:hypothetical protein
MLDRSLIARAAVAGALLTAAAPAFAEEASSGGPRSDPPAARSDATPSTRPAWYGWQVLLADVGAFALALLSTQSTGGDVTWLGVGGVAYAAGGPVIHAIHGRYVNAAVSLGLRVAVPLVGYALGASSAGCGASGTDCSVAPVLGGASGALAGIVIVSLIDIAALSWEPVAEPAAAPPNRGATLRVVPHIASVVDADQRRVLSFGVAGVL